MEKLLSQLNNSSPLALKTRGTNLSPFASISCKTEPFPEQVALQRIQLGRIQQLKVREEQRVAAAMMLREWRSRIMNRLRKRVQEMTLSRYLLRRSGPSVFLALMRAVRRRASYVIASCHLLTRLKRIYLRSAIERSRRIKFFKLSAVSNPQLRCWWRIWTRKRRFMAISREAESILAGHSASRYKQITLRKTFANVMSSTLSRVTQRNFTQKANMRFAKNLMHKGLIALLLNRKVRLQQRVDIRLLENNRRPFNEVSKSRSIQDIVDWKYSHQLCNLSSVEELYVAHVTLRISWQCFKSKTITKIQKLRLASTIHILSLCRKVFHKIKCIRRKRNIHMEILLDKLAAVESGAVKSKLPITIIPRCVLSQPLQRLYLYSVGVQTCRHAIFRADEFRTRKKLSEYLRFWQTWVLSRGSSCVASKESGQLSTIIQRSRSHVPLLPKVGQSVRSVTIMDTPRSALTDFTDDVDNSTLFGGGSTMRSSLHAAVIHYILRNWKIFVQKWIQWMLKRQQELKTSVQLSETLETARRLQGFRLAICWRVYFLFSTGRKVSSSVLAQHILAATELIHSKNEPESRVKSSKNATSMLMSELVYRFKNLGEVHFWQKRIYISSYEVWKRRGIFKFLSCLKNIYQKKKRLLRMDRANMLLKEIYAVRTWRTKFVPRSRWMRSRMEAANFVTTSKYFRQLTECLLGNNSVNKRERVIRKRLRNKFRSALGFTHFSLLARSGLRSLYDKLYRAKLSLRQDQAMDDYYFDKNLRKCFSSIKCAASHSLQNLRFSSHHHDLLLMRRGLNSLKDLSSRIKEVNYQYKNTDIVAPSFYAESMLCKGLSILRDSRLRSLQKYKIKILSHKHFLGKKFLVWQNRYTSSKTVLLKQYSSVFFWNQKNMQRAFCKFKNFNKLGKIQFSKLKHITGGNYKEKIHSNYENHPDWVEYINEDGHPYFYNDSTGESVWKLPCSAIERRGVLSGRSVDQLFTSERRAVRQCIVILKRNVSVSRYLYSTRIKQIRLIFFSWRELIVKWKRIKGILVINVTRFERKMKSYMSLLFKRWFLNTYPTTTIQKYDKHRKLYLSRLCWTIWFFKYKNSELIQEALDRAERKQLENSYNEYHQRRVMTASLTTWFNLLSKTLFTRTLLRRLDGKRNVKLMHVAMNNLRACADDGYERSVILQRVTSYDFVSKARKAVCCLFNYSCSRFAASQRTRIGNIFSARQRKKRALRMLLSNSLYYQNRRRRKT